MFNGLQLGEVAEIEAQMFSFAQKFNRRTTVEFSTKPRHFAKLLVQATPPVSDIQQSTLITFFIYYLTVKIE